MTYGQLSPPNVTGKYKTKLKTQKYISNYYVWSELNSWKAILGEPEDYARKGLRLQNGF